MSYWDNNPLIDFLRAAIANGEKLIGHKSTRDKVTGFYHFTIYTNKKARHTHPMERGEYMRHHRKFREYRDMLRAFKRLK
jgi:hypothetical protein